MKTNHITCVFFLKTSTCIKLPTFPEYLADMYPIEFMHILCSYSQYIRLYRYMHVFQIFDNYHYF